MENQLKFLISRSRGQTRNPTTSGLMKPYHSTGFNGGAKLYSSAELQNRSNERDIISIAKSTNSLKISQASVQHEKDDLR